MGSSPAIPEGAGCSISGSAFILGVSGIGSSPIIPKSRSFSFSWLWPGVL